MIIHSVLLLLTNCTIRAAEIIIGLTAGVARTSGGLAGRFAAAHLGITIQAESQILARRRASLSGRSLLGHYRNEGRA